MELIYVAAAIMMGLGRNGRCYWRWHSWRQAD